MRVSTLGSLPRCIAGFWSRPRACRTLCSSSTGNGRTATSSSNGSSSLAARQQLVEPPAPMQHTKVLSEEVIYQRYITVYQRRVQFSSPSAAEEDPGHVIDFDIAGHPQADFSFAVTFPFHPNPDGTKGGSVTLVKEYAQGLDALMYCLPTGGMDPAKHSSLLACAQSELSEEAWLRGDRWVPLLPEGHPGLAEVKWCRNRFQPFLVIDPQPDGTPGSRDAEEVSLEVLRVPLEEFRSLMTSGDLLLPSVTTAFLALQRLQQMGLID